jgi:hypothetical protein
VGGLPKTAAKQRNRAVSSKGVVDPAARVNPQRVKAYVAHLEGLQNGTWTILARLKDLGAAAKVMGPDEDWQFIKDISSRTRARHQPVRDKRNMKLTEELLALGFDLMKKAEAKTGLAAAVLFRDGLLIAFLALTALRRRNLATMRLGESLIEVNGRWEIEYKETRPRPMDRMRLVYPTC